MKNVRLFPSFLLAAGLAVLFLVAARAEDTEVSSIKFSDPSKPGVLKLSVSNGDLRIHGTDSDEITVQSEAKKETHEPRPDGLRVISSSSSYSLTEKNNVVTLSYGAGAWHGGGGDFDITVPRSTSVYVSNSLGGDIEIRNIAGDIEVKSLNGEVTLGDVSAGALVETMNGEIEVDVKAIIEAKPLSFTSMNGEVKITLPVDAKANVQLRTHNGTILTDFDEKQLVTKTASLKRSNLRYGSHDRGSSDNEDMREAVREAMRVGMEAAREATEAAREAIREAREEMSDGDEVSIAMPTPPIPPLPPMTGGKIVTGTLNGGGPEIRVSTMNGTVTLLKAK